MGGVKKPIPRVFLVLHVLRHYTEFSVIIDNINHIKHLELGVDLEPKTILRLKIFMVFKILGTGGIDKTLLKNFTFEPPCRDRVLEVGC